MDKLDPVRTPDCIQSNGSQIFYLCRHLSGIRAILAIITFAQFTKQRGHFYGNRHLYSESTRANEQIKRYRASQLTFDAKLLLVRLRKRALAQRFGSRLLVKVVFCKLGWLRSSCKHLAERRTIRTHKNKRGQRTTLVERTAIADSHVLLSFESHMERQNRDIFDNNNDSMEIIFLKHRKQSNKIIL